MKMDEQIKPEDCATQQGTTACVVLITPDKIFCSNSGDSRGVLMQGDTAIGLSEDHKPDNTIERDRIYNANHTVMSQRVDGCLALSRAFGDYRFKDQDELKPEEQAVTAFPDITSRDRTKEDKFIMLACDGIWDCLTNEQCCKKMAYYIKDLGQIHNV